MGAEGNECQKRYQSQWFIYNNMYENVIHFTKKLKFKQLVPVILYVTYYGFCFNKLVTYFNVSLDLHYVYLVFIS